MELREEGHCKRFVCPYHAWTYRTDGQLDHVRHREAFPSLEQQDTALASLHAVEYGPFVWVCPTRGLTPSIDPELRSLVDEIDGFGFGELAAFARESNVWHANWKLLVEGGLEAYHFKIAHRSTIGGLFTDTRASFQVFGDHLRGVLPRSSIRSLADTPEAQWSLVAHANVLYTLSPNASVLVQDGHYAIILMTPQAPDRSLVEMITVGRPVAEGQAGARVRGFLDANHQFTVTTLNEDFVLAEQIQGGLSSGANSTLRLGRFEHALTAWHERLDERLEAAAESGASQS